MTQPNNSWLRVSMPFPREDLLTLVTHTPSAIASLANSQSERELQRARQRTLQGLGSATLEAIVIGLIYQHFDVRDSNLLVTVGKELHIRDGNLFGELAEAVIRETELVKHGWDNDERSPLRKRTGDALLAFLGAHSLAGTLGEVEIWLAEYLVEKLKMLVLHRGEVAHTDWKSLLQDIAQKRAGQRPSYVVIGESGPHHDRVFEVVVIAKGVGKGIGSGRSKKEAERAAAYECLKPVLKSRPSIVTQRIGKRFAKSAGKTDEARPNVVAKLEQTLRSTPLSALCTQITVLMIALTHRSFTAGTGAVDHNAPLATVGSQILNAYALREIIRATWDDASEESSRSHLAAFHRGESITKLFDEWHLRDLILLGSGESRDQCSQNLCKECVCAIVGACYADAHSLERALVRLDRFAGRYFSHHLRTILTDDDSARRDPKSVLQSITQIVGSKPEYRELRVTGRADSSQHQCAVRIPLPLGEPIPWLVAGSAPIKAKSEENAAVALIRIMQAWAKEGEQAAVRIFRNPRGSAQKIVKSAARIVVEANLLANRKQHALLRRAGVAILAGGPEELSRLFEKVAEFDQAWLESLFDRLTRLDDKIGERKSARRGHLSPMAPFLRLATSPKETTAEIQMLIDSLLVFLNELEPESWSSEAARRNQLLTDIVAMANVLKCLADDGQEIDPLGRIRESGLSVSADDNAAELRVYALPKLMDWFVSEIIEPFGGSAMRLHSANGPSEIRIEWRAGREMSLPPMLLRLLNCSDLVMFGFGATRVTAGPESISIRFRSDNAGPLVKSWLEEGRTRLRELADFGPALHDAKNSLLAIDLLWNRSRLDARRKYHYFADMADKLDSLRATLETLKTEQLVMAETQPVPLSEFIARYREQAIRLLPSSIDFSTLGQHDDEYVDLDLDAKLMARAIDNIIKNAREAIGQSAGEIRLEWLVDQQNAVALLSVTDNGPGMSEEALEMVRAGGFSTKKPMGGVGLGLRSATRIVDAHGGELTIQSQLGRGTTVMIELPLAQSLDPQLVLSDEAVTLDSELA